MHQLDVENVDKFDLLTVNSYFIYSLCQPLMSLLKNILSGFWRTDEYTCTLFLLFLYQNKLSAIFKQFLRNAISRELGIFFFQWRHYFLRKCTYFETIKNWLLIIEVIDWIFGGKYKYCRFIWLPTILSDEKDLSLEHFATWIFPDKLLK